MMGLATMECENDLRLNEIILVPSNPIFLTETACVTASSCAISSGSKPQKM